MIKKNAETRIKKKVVGDEYLLYVLPNSLNVGRYICILLKDVVRLVGV